METSQALYGALVALTRPVGISGGFEQPRVMPQPAGDVCNVVFVECFGGKAAPAMTEVAGIQTEPDLVGWIPQSLDLFLKAEWQIEGSLALGSVHPGRCVESVLFAGRENLHAWHKLRLFPFRIGFDTLYL